MEKKDKDIGHICLTLKTGNTIRIGEDVEVFVMQTGGHPIGNAVRVRVTAPVAKKIYRVKKNAEPSKP
jgi:sRNA-binding carbon storage regulator CsrA